MVAKQIPKLPDGKTTKSKLIFSKPHKNEENLRDFPQVFNLDYIIRTSIKWGTKQQKNVLLFLFVYAQALRKPLGANGFGAEIFVLRPRGVYTYVGGRKRKQNKNSDKNEENLRKFRRFSTLIA